MAAQGGRAVRGAREGRVYCGGARRRAARLGAGRAGPGVLLFQFGAPAPLGTPPAPSEQEKVQFDATPLLQNFPFGAHGHVGKAARHWACDAKQ